MRCGPPHVPLRRGHDASQRLSPAATPHLSPRRWTGPREARLSSNRAARGALSGGSSR